MIVAPLNTSTALYAAPLASALQWLRVQNWDNLPDGRYELSDGIFAQVFSIAEPRESAFFEVHQIYADVQYIIAGCEKVSWAVDAAEAKEVEAYDAARDIAFYQQVPHSLNFNLAAGWFAIYPAGELHAVGVSAERDFLRKAVLKIPQSLLQEAL